MKKKMKLILISLQLTLLNLQAFAAADTPEGCREELSDCNRNPETDKLRCEVQYRNCMRGLQYLSTANQLGDNEKLSELAPPDHQYPCTINDLNFAFKLCEFYGVRDNILCYRVNKEDHSEVTINCDDQVVKTFILGTQTEIPSSALKTIEELSN